MNGSDFNLRKFRWTFDFLSYCSMIRQNANLGLVNLECSQSVSFWTQSLRISIHDTLVSKLFRQVTSEPLTLFVTSLIFGPSLSNMGFEPRLTEGWPAWNMGCRGGDILKQIFQGKSVPISSLSCVPMLPTNAFKLPRPELASCSFPYHQRRRSLLRFHSQPG